LRLNSSFVVKYINIDIGRPVKPIAFLGGSLDDLRGFPVDARREAGYQLDRVQRGLDPDDWRPMASIGAGERAGAFRVIYVATFADVVYVLHAFQKKTRQTAKRDVDLAASGLREQVARMR
jgi:phage-related protein